MKKKTKKPVDLNITITRTFLNTLADRIYGRNGKTFLRLCDGVLQNGPDPKDSKRSMHCGLGELYFAATGLQPDDTGVDEDDVIKLIVDRSTIPSRIDYRHVREVIDTINVNNTLKSDVQQYIDELRDFDEDQDVQRLTSILNQIPKNNDDLCGDVCDDKTFKARSKRVADVIRQAAKILPKD